MEEHKAYQDANPETPFEREQRQREQLRASFDAVSRPVVKWLNANSNPHAIAIIGNDGAELVEGCLSVSMPEEVPD